eukprot:scaffold1690_cov177-Ochromonas_danica.AAC.8
MSSSSSSSSSQMMTTLPVVNDEELLASINETTLLFDRIFHRIAPTKKYNQPMEDSLIEIKPALLTDFQCQCIAQLSGFLIKLRNNLEDRHLMRLKTNSALATIPFPTTSIDVDNDGLSIQEKEKKIILLKEFLVNELARTEELDKQVHKLEAEIVLLTEEKESLKKKIVRQQPAEKIVRPKPTPVKAEPVVVPKDPGKYIGVFIRKKFEEQQFFGIAANYTEPYYQIVYEDADFEDLAASEVEKVLWKSTVPTYKRDACIRHAKKLCMLHDSLLNQSDGLTVKDTETSSSNVSGRKVLSQSSTSSAITTTSSGDLRLEENSAKITSNRPSEYVFVLNSSSSQSKSSSKPSRASVGNGVKSKAENVNTTSSKTVVKKEATIAVVSKVAGSNSTVKSLAPASSVPASLSTSESGNGSAAKTSTVTVKPCTLEKKKPEESLSDSNGVGVPPAVIRAVKTEVASGSSGNNGSGLNAVILERKEAHESSFGGKANGKSLLDDNRVSSNVPALGGLGKAQENLIRRYMQASSPVQTVSNVGVSGSSASSITTAEHNSNTPNNGKGVVLPGSNDASRFPPFMASLPEKVNVPSSASKPARPAAAPTQVQTQAPAAVDITIRPSEETKSTPSLAPTPYRAPPVPQVVEEVTRDVSLPQPSPHKHRREIWQKASRRQDLHKVGQLLLENFPNKGMIRFFLLQNRQGKTRLSKWYSTPPEDAERVKMENDINRVISLRTRGHTNFVEYQNFKLIYRRYAGLYFIFGADVTDNELLLMESIHIFVEILDVYFSNVCELDIVFHFNKVYSVLDEFILAGEVQETSKRLVVSGWREPLLGESQAWSERRLCKFQ